MSEMQTIERLRVTSSAARKALRYSVVGLVLAGSPPPFSSAQTPLPDSPAVEQRVNTMLAKMSTAEKITLLGGKDNFYTQAIPSAGLPRLRMADGPLGVRNWGASTAYTAGIALAASWDTALAHRVGESLGNDSRARGVHFLLAPGVNIYRSPLNGRNMEYFGEDPWLSSRMAVGYITGLQSKGVSATVKHFAANNSEFDRHNSDSVVDERTLHEIYLPAFEAAVKEANVGAVMDSYNLINGAHATQNKVLNVDILRKQWGFKGVLMSDWDATYDGIAAANNGLDLEMPSAKFMNAKNLVPALSSGAVTQATIDEKVRRILRTAIRFGWLDRDQLETDIPLLSPASSRVALDEALASITLLKNEGHLLPLEPGRQHSYVVLGPDAAIPVVGGGGSSRVGSFFTDTILTAVTNLVGTHAKVYYIPGLPTAEHLFAETAFTSATVSVYEGPNSTGAARSTSNIDHLDRWRENGNYGNDSGRSANGQTSVYHLAYTPATTGNYLLVTASPAQDDTHVMVNGKEVLANAHHGGPSLPVSATISLEAGKPVQLEVRYFTHASGSRLSLGLRSADSEFTPAERQMIASADAAIVAVGLNASIESEGYDRAFKLPWGQDALVAATAAINSHTIVDIEAGGAVDVHTWLDRVPVLLDSYYGGQSTGEALARVLFGQSPSGHLPMSWEREAEDNPTFNHYFEEPGPGKKIPYGEGLFYGYRYYTSTHKQPLFPFGFGLSYTTFDLSNLKLTSSTQAGHMLTVEFDVRNTGKTPGAEVAQVYVGDPSAAAKRPLKELKAFTKVELDPGKSQHVSLALDRRSFSYWDETVHDWRMDSGRFDITVGNSSTDDCLTGHVELKN